MEYEILDKAGNVSNRLLATPEFMAEHHAQGTYRALPDSADAGPVSTPSRNVSRKAFLSRFTDAEAIDIDLASIGATREAATVRRYLSKVNAAQHIDLADDETRTGVQALEAAGLLQPGRALAILDAPIEPKEVP